MSDRGSKLEDVFPATRSAMGPEAWRRLAAEASDPGSFQSVIEREAGGPGLPQFLPELARLEFSLRVAVPSADVPSDPETTVLNPSVMLLQNRWKGLLDLAEGPPGDMPAPGTELVLVWKDPASGEVRSRVAGDGDLLALKMVVEGIAPEDLAGQGGFTIGRADDIIDRAVREGLLLRPASMIRRDASFPRGRDIPEEYFTSPVFTLQWHVTQACDLHCRHCYDRSDIHSLTLDDAVRILDDMRAFCRSRNVSGHISFTGGNPLLYPHFFDLYQAAADRGFSLAVLGNPAPKAQMERIQAIQPLSFYQVSLEGLEAHNDSIRGDGHFNRVMEFLGVLRDLGVYSMVMLTLTSDNMDQVLPLAELLRDKADLFTFNRLSQVGEGAALAPADRERYAAFLTRYMKAAEANRVISLKDNLINIHLRRAGAAPFGGCAGHGCGAAFNFFTVLPNGEAHACRKLPSPIGNVIAQGIAGVYDSEIAQRYRTGCLACASCEIRPVCGGCLAVSHGMGLDIFSEKDPYCFIR